MDDIREKGNLDMLANFHNPDEILERIHIIQPPGNKGGAVEINENITVHRTRFPNPAGVFGTVASVAGLLCMLIRGVYIAKRKDVDLIRGQGIVASGIISLVLKWATGVPNATSIHNDYDKRREAEDYYEMFGSPLLTELVERLVIRRSSAVFVLTPYLREIILRHGADEEDVYVLPTHIPVDRFDPLSESEREAKRTDLGLDDGFTLVFVGRLAEQKDPFTLLEGFRLAKADLPDLQLVVVGDGYHRDEMEAYVDDHDLEDDVVFTGFVDRDEVGNIMSAGDALVHPTLFEGLGLVYMEAQAVGTPILTTDIAHVKTVANDENAFIFPPGDEEGLAEQIRAVQNDNRREEMIKRGQETVQRFSSDYQHPRHATALKEVADRGVSRKNR